MIDFSKVLITEKGVNVDTRGYNGTTPLFGAVCIGKLKTVEVRRCMKI